MQHLTAIKDSGVKFDVDQQHLLQSFLTSCKRNGAGLESLRKKKFEEINSLISQKSATFLQNVNEDKSFVTFSDDELEGLLLMFALTIRTS
jgi:Zn-dependent oligopeptidase